MAAAVMAAVGTGVWSICLAQAGPAKGDEVRYALIGAGLLSLLSMLVSPPCHVPTERSAGLAVVLAAYQALIYMAVSRGGAVMQAVINCNIAVVCVHRHLFVKAAAHPLALAVAVASAACSAAVLVSTDF